MYLYCRTRDSYRDSLSISPYGCHGYAQEEEPSNSPKPHLQRLNSKFFVIISINMLCRTMVSIAITMVSIIILQLLEEPFYCPKFPPLWWNPWISCSSTLRPDQDHPGLQDTLGGEYGARCGMSKSSNVPQKIHFLGAALQVIIIVHYLSLKKLSKKYEPILKPSPKTLLSVCCSPGYHHLQWKSIELYG